MRLGELKNIIDNVYDKETNQIIIDAISIFGGNAYKINNYNVLIKTLLELEKQNSKTSNLDYFNNLLEKYGDSDSCVIIEPSEYTELTAYVYDINREIPIFYKILNNFVKPQDKYLINIKLPDHDDYTLQNLEENIKQIKIIFNSISTACNISASYQVVGVASGSKWIEININASEISTIYAIVMGIIGIATGMANLRTAYYKSEAAKLSYKVLDKNYKDKISFDKHIDKMLQTQKEAKIQEILYKNSITDSNAFNQICKSVDLITTELGKGIEFHPSLNPPEYINKTNGIIEIDYKVFKKIEKENNKPKQIENFQATEQEKLNDAE